MSDDDITDDATYQRGLIEVPSPWTKLTVGLVDAATSYSGVAADSAEHVRLYGKGGKSDSDLIAQATGQVWIQALESVVGLAKEKVVVSGVGSTHFLASRGISIMAGFSPSDLAPEAQPGVLPSAVRAYDSNATTAQTVGLAFTAAAGILATAAKGLEIVKGTSFSKTCASTAASNVAGLAVNVAAAADRDLRLPMIHLYSEAGTVVGSAINSVNITGMAGATVGSTFVTHHGLANSKVRGWRRASLNAIGPVDISGLLYFGCRGISDFTLAARTGTITARGKTMTVGLPYGKVNATQRPTTTLQLNALQTISLTSMKDLKLGSRVMKSTAGTSTAMTATTALKLKAGPWEIQLTPTSGTIGGEGPSVTVGAGRLATKGLLAITTATMTTSQIDLAAGMASLKIKPGASITIDGTEFKYQ